MGKLEEKSKIFSNQFNSNKMGMKDDEIYEITYKKLTQNLDNFEVTFSKTLDTYFDCQNHYSNSMQKALDQVEYFNQGDFMKQHQNLKNDAISQVCKLILELYKKRIAPLNSYLK